MWSHKEARLDRSKTFTRHIFIGSWLPVDGFIQIPLEAGEHIANLFWTS
jgi:hypothetical protein